MVSATRDNPPPSYPGELTFHFHLYKIQPTVYMKLCTRLRMREEGNGRSGRGRVVSPRQVK